MNSCAAILILKMEENMHHFWHIMLYYFKKSATKMQKEDFCSLWRSCLTIKHIKNGLWSFLVLLTFWQNNSLLWGYFRYWKMFSSSPGLYPLEANMGDGRHTPNIQICKVIGKMKNVSFILWKKLNGLFGQPNIFFIADRQSCTNKRFFFQDHKIRVVFILCMPPWWSLISD